jgi:hypothetical protein
MRLFSIHGFLSKEVSAPPDDESTTDSRFCQALPEKKETRTEAPGLVSAGADQLWHRIQT